MGRKFLPRQALAGFGCGSGGCKCSGDCPCKRAAMGDANTHPHFQIPRPGLGGFADDPYQAQSIMDAISSAVGNPVQGASSSYTAPTGTGLTIEQLVSSGNWPTFEDPSALAVTVPQGSPHTATWEWAAIAGAAGLVLLALVSGGKHRR